MNFTKRQLEEMVERQKRMMMNDRNFYLAKIRKLEEENKMLQDQISELKVV